MIHEENGQIIVDDVTSELIDAAEKYAEIYSDDERQDIKTDVLNAFYHGANYQKKCQQDQIIVDELRPMSELKNKQFALCHELFNQGRYGQFEKYQKWDMTMVDINGDEFDIDKFVGWIPIPIYRPKVK